MHLVDRDTVQDLIAGNRLAFKTVYDKLGGGVYSVAVQITKEQFLAEEVVQEVFTRLWLHRDKIDTEGNLWVFLYVVAKRLSINKLRSIKRAKAAHDGLAEQVTGIADSFEERIFYQELVNLLNLTIADLPEKQRQVIEMSRNEGLTHQQIAERLGISPNTVNNHITRALKQLKAKLKGKNGDLYMAFVTFFF
ncbi:RNA polymerase sigma factor [Sphingobacterium tabacisoli]|uniref:RNA polymerase sigma factor n=1 Tax=Sphingobacterium tabacisoli TaxID=2044855 RepID=A0ABW5L028_9SPHI|nr:RNA polymerase sigma-70 factor [Sphingobacterium tabacisoli]